MLGGRIYILSQWFQNFSERDTNLSLVNISRAELQAANFDMKNIFIVGMTFGCKVPSTVSTSAIYSFDTVM